MDDALVHSLGFDCGIRRLKQGDGFQVFNLGVGRAVVDDHGDFSFLSLEASIKLNQPCGEEVRRNPRFLDCFVSWW